MMATRSRAGARLPLPLWFLHLVVGLEGIASTPNPYKCSDIKRKLRLRRISTSHCPHKTMHDCNLTSPEVFTNRCPVSLPWRPLFAPAPQRGMQSVLPVFQRQLAKGRCAVVSNGGSLLGSRCGLEIDAHNVVWRINAPVLTRAFTPDVGSRTDVMVINQLLSRNLSQLVVHDRGDPSHDRPFHLAGLDVVMLSTLAPGILRDQAHSIMAKHRMRSLVGASTVGSTFALEVNKWFGMIHDHSARMKAPSKGIYSVLLAMIMCDEVDVYGFTDQLTGQPYHYWDTVQDWHTGAEGSKHAMNLEHKLLDVFAARPVTLCMIGLDHQQPASRPSKQITQHSRAPLPTAPVPVPRAKRQSLPDLGDFA